MTDRKKFEKMIKQNFRHEMIDEKHAFLKNDSMTCEFEKKFLKIENIIKFLHS